MAVTPQAPIAPVDEQRIGAQQAEEKATASVTHVFDAPAPLVDQVAVCPSPAQKAPEPFKRRDRSSETELQAQLLLVPQIGLDHAGKSKENVKAQAKVLVKKFASDKAVEWPATLVADHRDLQGLPFAKGNACQLDQAAAWSMHTLAPKLRTLLKSDDGADLRAALLSDSATPWREPGAVPCLMQMMQVENAARRKLLVEILSQNKDKTATLALARRAMTDLNPEVREAAARALLDRPRDDYRPLLLDGLRYPWTPVATHAAETLAFVKDTDAVPQLAAILKQPDLATTLLAPESQGKTPMIREVVRINHVGNCLLCHPPSLASSDLVRGSIPGTVQGQSAMNYGPGGPPCTPDPPPIFVRADATYLRQDFSVMHEEQRFDYMVRTRAAMPEEISRVAPGHLSSARIEVRFALQFALREITGQDYQLDGIVVAARR
jgi:hypothetical protein